jgi:DNA-binding transcriptional LysR family regulator
MPAGALTRADIDNFLELEAHRSFTAAARALGISQPALTTAIRKMESKIGLRLFHRTWNGIDLTSSGMTLLPDMRRARDALRAVEQAAVSVGESRLGMLRLTCRAILAREPVARLVGHAHRSHPELGIEVQQMGVGVTSFETIRAGLADVGVTTDDDTLDGVQVQPLGSIDLVALVPPDASVPERPTVDDLLALGLLSMNGFGMINRALARRVGTQAVTEAIVLRSDFHGMLARFALQGRGVHFVPRRTGEMYQVRGARVIAPVDHPVLSVVATYVDEDCSPAARAFLAIAQEKFDEADLP